MVLVSVEFERREKERMEDPAGCRVSGEFPDN